MQSNANSFVIMEVVYMPLSNRKLSCHRFRDGLGRECEDALGTVEERPEYRYCAYTSAMRVHLRRIEVLLIHVKANLDTTFVNYVLLRL